MQVDRQYCRKENLPAEVGLSGIQSWTIPILRVSRVSGNLAGVIEGGLRCAQWHWLLADGLGSLTQSDFDSFSWWGSQYAALLQDRLEWKPPCQCKVDESPVEDQSLDLQYFMLGEVAQKLSSRRGRKGGYVSFVCWFDPEYCLLLLANTVCCPGTWQWGWVKSSALKETYSNPKKLWGEGHFLSLAQMK